MLSLLIPFLVATLTGLGVGGGGLFVIYLALMTDTPQLLAQGMNLLFFLFSSSASLVVHVTQRTLYPTLILMLTVTGLGGSLLGSFLAERVSAHLLRRAFGMMLVITGIFALKKRERGKE